MERRKAAEFTYEADQAILHFTRTDEVDQGTGENIWKITYWEDRPIGALASM